jgi:hypothetical protein
MAKRNKDKAGPARHWLQDAMNHRRPRLAGLLWRIRGPRHSSSQPRLPLKLNRNDRLAAGMLWGIGALLILALTVTAALSTINEARYGRALVMLLAGLSIGAGMARMAIVSFSRFRKR